MNRVVITGLGIVSPLGKTVADVTARLRTGRTAIGPITNIPTDGLITKIVVVSPSDAAAADAEVIDARGLLVMPGVVDPDDVCRNA